MATEYSKYIGRVGALALALGVGMAVATSPGLGMARADSPSADSNGSQSADPSSTDGDSAPSTGPASDVNEAGPSSTTDGDSTPNEADDAPELGDDSPDADNDNVITDETSAGDDTDTPPDTTSSGDTDTPAPGDDTSGAVQRDGGSEITVPSNSDVTATFSPSTDTDDALSYVDSDSQSSDDPTTQPDLGFRRADAFATQRIMTSGFASTGLAPTPHVAATDPVGALGAIPGAVVNVATAVVSALLSPFIGTGPNAPSEPPLLWAVLGWVRREFFNTRPDATDDGVTTTVGISATGNVLTNDVDAEGDPLTATLVHGPEHGALTLNPDGSFAYIPNAGYHGADSFSYRASDKTSTWHLHGLLGLLSFGGGHTDTATVSINVDAIPLASNDSYHTDEDTALTVAGPGVLGNDADAEGNPLTAVVATGPGHGTLALNADGSFTYTPTANYNGTDSFTYRAGDGVATSNAATVTITIAPVEDAPVAQPDTYTVVQGHTLTLPAPGLLANDTDADGDTLHVDTVGSDPIFNGSSALSPTGALTYTPNADFVGTTTFTYKITDGIKSSTATVTINVVADTAPVAQPDTYTVVQGHTLTLPAPGLLANDTDADGDTLHVDTVGSDPIFNGSSVLSPTGALTYTPNADFVGTTTFTYKITDGIKSSTATVTINVVADTAPVAVDHTYTVAAGHTLTVAAPGLLVGASDADGDEVKVNLLGSGAPSNGQTAMSSTGFFRYTPDADVLGSRSFTYTVTDGIKISAPATVTINVVADQAPVGQPDAYTITQGHFASEAVPGLLRNDTDPEGDQLTIDLLGSSFPEHGTLDLDNQGSFFYTPKEGFLGDDTFTYRATDGVKTSDPITVTFHVIENHAPVGEPESYTVQHDTVLDVFAGELLKNDTDPDGDFIRYTDLVQDTSHGHLTLFTGRNGGPPGGFNYTPNQGFVGTDSFTYTPSDGALAGAPVTVTITVTDQAPIGQPESYTVKHDTVLNVFAGELSKNDTDPDGDDIRYTDLVQDASHGHVSLTTGRSGGPPGGFSYTPNQGFVGTDSFTYTPSDGALAGAPVTVTITVTDQAPIGQPESYTVKHDTVLNVFAGELSKNDTDPDGDDIRYTDLVQDASHGHVSLTTGRSGGPPGGFSYSPVAEYVGTDSFTYSPSDGALAGAPVTVTITVTN